MRLLMSLVMAAAVWLISSPTPLMALAEAPASLNLVLVGFHHPESGWISDFDLERTLAGTIVARTLSLGEGPFLRLRRVLSSFGNASDVPSSVMGAELESLTRSLGLWNDGFTLFVLNVGRGDGKPYAYCQSRQVEGTTEDGKESDAGNSVEADPKDRGESWGQASALTFQPGLDSTHLCNANDTCRVNAWITNERVAWIDLTASRIPWGNKFGLSLPNPPVHSMTLEEQRERAKHIKHIALTEKHCKECKSFLNAWASLLDRAAVETDFARAYDTVLKASDELENVIAREFVKTTSLFVDDDSRGFLASSASLATSIDFLAHLSLVVSSFANRVLLPFNAEAIRLASIYGFQGDSEEDERRTLDMLDDPTSRVTVHLYLVHGRDDQLASGPSEEDIARMRKELARLASPPLQTFSMIVHRLSLDQDPVLGAAFAFSLQTMIVPTLVDGRQVGRTRHYINAREFRQVLLSKNDRAQLSFDSPFSQSARTKRNSKHIELPVFWFHGVDSSKQPLYVDGFHRAVHLEDLVIVVESKHASVERLDAWCGSSRVKVSVARPLRAAIIATAHLWWSENLGESVASRYTEETIDDWTWAVGVGDARGLSLFEDRDEIIGQNLLSTVQVDAFHRANIIESIRKVNKVVDQAKKVNKHHPLLRDVNSLRGMIFKSARQSDWECAFKKLLLYMEKVDALRKTLLIDGFISDSRRSCAQQTTSSTGKFKVLLTNLLDLRRKMNISSLLNVVYEAFGLDTK